MVDVKLAPGSSRLGTFSRSLFQICRQKEIPVPLTRDLDKSEGFEVGVGPSVVVADKGMASSPKTTTTMKDTIYAFIFDQAGAMYVLGIQGNKITKIKK